MSFIDRLANFLDVLGSTGAVRIVIVAAVLFGLWRGLERAGFAPSQRTRTWATVAVPLLAWFALIWLVAPTGVFRVFPVKMRKLGIAASIHLSLLTAAGLTAASAADLTVTINGARNANGSIAAGIFASESGFPKPEQVFAAFRIKAKQGPVSFTVHDLPPGRYAVTAYHDENNNGKLDADPTGAPTEGYGVSNNAREILSPPFWSKASFEVGEPSKAVTIKVEY